jgi:hypothetical protein
MGPWIRTGTARRSWESKQRAGRPGKRLRVRSRPDRDRLGRPNHPSTAWLARERWNLPVIVDPDGEIADTFGLSAYP